VEYTLHVKERALLLGLLPKQGDVIKMKVIKQLLDRIGFDKDEIASLSIKFDSSTGHTTWSEDADKGVVFDLDDIEIEIIKTALGEIKDKITIDQLDLWELFMA